MLRLLFWPPIRLFWRWTSLLVNMLVQVSLVFTLTFSFCYKMGWCHRLMWSFLEQVVSTAMNGANVTIGSFSVDFLRGVLILNNVIVHSPLRQKYRWESPVLMRMGQVYVEFNPIWILFSKFILNDPSPPLEVNLLHMSDIQVFLERKDHVFNVYLLDPFFVPPSDGEEEAADGQAEGDSDVVQMENKEPKLTLSSSSFGYEQDDHGVEESPNQETEKDHNRAEQVVGEMFKAVQSLGRAVQEGQLPQALQEQRQRMTKGLKDFHVNKGAMTDGLSLMQQVSKMVVEKSHKAVAQSNLILQPKRQPPQVEEPVYARFGRVILDDLRVFTRATIVEEVADEKHYKKDKEVPDSHAVPADEQSGGVEVTPAKETQISNKQQKVASQEEFLIAASWDGEGDIIIDESNNATAPQTPNKALTSSATGMEAPTRPATKKVTTKSYWNKPITVTRVAVRSSEFGAPLNAKEEDTGFPVLYQTIDKSVDAIFKRVVGDMAKANTGRLVRTAMGEVLDFYMEKEYQEKS